MNQKRQLQSILLAAVLFLAALLVTHDTYKMILFIAAYLPVGLPVLAKACRNISRGDIFDENFLMAIATLGAFAVSEYPEAVAVMLFYQVGELFQSYAVNKSRKSIADLMDICPEYANLKQGDTVIQVDPEEVEIDAIILVKPGERVPLDGVVIEGSSLLNTVALTGEAMPRQIQTGDDIISGCINMDSPLLIRVTKEYEDSTVSKILDLVENAAATKAQTENFITKFARYYTPFVVLAAACIGLIPPLVLPDAAFADWIYRALVFLVISCPCALVISIPLSFFGGIGGASRLGILVKGSNYLEALAKSEIVAFDKTGTLTKGEFQVSKIVPQAPFTAEQLLEIAAYGEYYSNHPIARAIQTRYGKPIEEKRLGETKEEAGHGMVSTLDGKEILLGNSKLMNAHQISFTPTTAVGTVVYAAVDGAYAGYLIAADTLKEDAAEAIQTLKLQGIKQTVMLTGDNAAIGEAVGRELSMDQIFTRLLPADKVSRMEELKAQTSAQGKLVFVGDGINDAPVLAGADIGIAMGGMGSDAAIEAADIVIMTDQPKKVATAIAIAKKTLSIVKENIVFALGVKGLVLLLGAFGIATMWEAVFADVGVAVIAILNAMRALKTEHLS